MDYLFLARLEEVPALLRWVDSCVLAGYMSPETADDWRKRIHGWREWLERTAAIR